MIKNNLKVTLSFTIAVLSGVILLVKYSSIPLVYISPYPEGRNFAFTVTDDPDGARVDKIKPVYELLDRLGFKTTIAAWVYKPEDLAGMPDPEEQRSSETFEDADYLAFLEEQRSRGFEIALHTVTAGNDTRDITVKGYEKFKDVLGQYPKINIMHSKNLENIYWGKNVFKNSITRFLVGLYDKTLFSGEYRDSPYFWGDICKDKTKYVRLWGTSDINTLKFNPSMPYSDSTKPYVNAWFSFSDGYTAKYFKKLLSAKNIEKLVKERGSCIVYTHFAASFCKKNITGEYEIDTDIKKSLINLSKQKEGWFVTAGELLDRFSEIKNLQLRKNNKELILTNLGCYSLEGVTIMTKPFMQYSDSLKARLCANEEGEILIGHINSGESKIIKMQENFRVRQVPMHPGFLERNRLVWQRIKILLFSHRG